MFPWSWGATPVAPEPGNAFRIGHQTEEALRQAIARAYTSAENIVKFLDPALTDAIVREILAINDTHGEPVAQGWKLVPVEPTEAVLRPFYECPPDELLLAWDAMLKIAETYFERSMLAAAPAAPTQAKPTNGEGA